MDRESAITILAGMAMKSLTVAQREDYLVSGWWCLDADDAEFNNLPEQIQFAIQYEETPVAPEDPRYDPLLLMSLVEEYR